MGGMQLLKSMGTLDHINQRNYESLGDFYTMFNKELLGIDQVITGGETIHVLVGVLGPRVSALYDSPSVIPVNTVEEMVTRVKSYIDLEKAKEGRKVHKEASNKEIQEGKKQEQRPTKGDMTTISIAHLYYAPIEKSMILSLP